MKINEWPLLILENKNENKMTYVVSNGFQFGKMNEQKSLTVNEYVKK